MTQARPRGRLALPSPALSSGSRLRGSRVRPVWSLWDSDMAYRGQGQKVQKVMVQPIWHLQTRSCIQVWLYEQVNMQIEGCGIGFDEYINQPVLDDAEEIHSKMK